MNILLLFIIIFFLVSTEPSLQPKEEISFMGVNIETLPKMDSREVEEIFKGVLTDDSQVCSL